MKKMLLGCIAAMTILTVSAGVDFGVWKDCPDDIKYSSVEGVRLRLPVTDSNGTVEGAELALLMAGSAEVEGLQIGFFNHAKSDDGFQWGFLNICEDDATFQLGFLNFNKNGLLPVMIFVNFGSDIFD